MTSSLFGLRNVIQNNTMASNKNTALKMPFKTGLAIFDYRKENLKK